MPNLIAFATRNNDGTTVGGLVVEHPPDWLDRGHSCSPRELRPQDADGNVRNVRAPLHGRMLFLCVSALVSLSAAYGEDWPEFRGPTGQGHSTTQHLPIEWSATRNIALKQSIPGEGWSSPVLVRGRIYLTTAVPASSDSGLSLRVLCLDAADGKIYWDSEVFKDTASRKHNKNSHASATPLIENERLYTHFGHYGTACLDLNGKVLWRNTSLAYPPVHGNGGSPAIVDDVLIFSCDGESDPFIAALNKQTGKVVWKVNRETKASKTFSFSTPLAITVNGQKQVISAGSGMVCALNPKTGREIWRVLYGEGYSVIPRPVSGNGLLFICTGFDRPTVIAVRPDGRGDVTDTHVVWTLARGAPNTPSPLLVGDELYLVSDAGIASCVDARTGKVHWQERVGGNYSASPVFADGRIYLQSEEGKGVVLKAGREFQKLAENPLNERSLASYAIGEGALFVRTEDYLFRIEAAR